MLLKHLPKNFALLNAALFFCFLIFYTQQIFVQAGSGYTNPDTGYEVIIEDDAGLLTDSELASLEYIMKEITAFGNVGFKTISVNYTSASSYIRSYYTEKFGTESGIVFLIDMDNRKIWIHSNGAIYRKVTKSYADTITDNVYTYASKGNYYTCAYEAYAQILARINGQRIAQPMKYISNAFLAVIFALLINYFFVKAFSRMKKPTNGQLLQGIQKQCNITDPSTSFTHQTSRYAPETSNDSSSSSGGSSSSSSGGGGGHSF